MKKHISNHLRMATIVMGITLATSAMAREDHKDSKANDLLCVTLNDVDNVDALAILQVEKNGLAHGVVCYLDLDSVDDAIDNCNLVTGQALKSHDGSPRYLDISLIGSGLDAKVLNADLTQTNAHINFAQGEAVGYGVAATKTSASWGVPMQGNLAHGDAQQSACRVFKTPGAPQASSGLHIFALGTNRTIAPGPSAQLFGNIKPVMTRQRTVSFP